MTIYQQLILVVSIILLFQKVYPKKKQRILFFAFAVLGIFAGIRLVPGVGVDMGRYFYHFRRITYSSLSEAYSYSATNKLFYIIMWAAGKIGLSFQLYTFFITLFCVMTYTWYVNRNSNSHFISVYLYLGLGTYTFLFSGLKQSFAIALGLICMDALLNYRYFKALCFLFLAVLVHPTAVIIFPLFFLSKIHLNNLVIAAYLVIVGIVAIFRTRVGSLVTLLFAEDYWGHYESKGSIGGTAVFVIIMWLLYLIFNYKNITKKGNEHCLFFHALTIMLIIQLCASYAYSFTRLNLYFMTSIIPIVVPSIVENDVANHTFGRGWKIVRIMYMAVIIALMIYLFNNHIIGESLTEYRFCWQV